MSVIGVVAAVVVVLIILRYLPVQRKILNEGVFDKKKYDRDFFRGTPFVAYYFESDCRECMERGGKEYLALDECHVAIARSALRLGIFSPEQGDSVKIIGWKSIFGKVVAYKLEKTNFAEEFGSKQLQQEEDAWDAYREASDKREALKRGVTIEEYRVQRREESIQNAAEELGIDREEVVAGNYHELSSIELHAERIARKRSNEEGQEVTRDEILEEERRRANEPFEQTKDADVCYEGYEYSSASYHSEYAETGTLIDKRALEHIKCCPNCSQEFEVDRQRYLESPSTPQCLTNEDLVKIKRSGALRGFEEYPGCCYRCFVLFLRRRDEHLAGVPGLDCLTPGDLHGIHTTGQVPEGHSSHVPSCERCRHAFEEHRKKWLDQVAPLPELPHIRMKSFRKRQVTA